MLSENQLIRYERQVILDGVGASGQEKILEARVLVVGAGGLGSPALLYLAAAGVGRLGIVDDDRLELSNLQRQVIYSEKDLGRLKTTAAAARIRALNGGTEVRELPVRLDASNARELLRGYHFVLDCTDNFSAKFLVNDTCVAEGIPFCHGAVLGLRGQVLTWTAGKPCYRCLFREKPPPGSVPDCRRAGVLGVSPGLVGVIQAAEALKYFLGIGRLLEGRLLTIEAGGLDFRSVPFPGDPGCAACGSPAAAGSEDGQAGACGRTRA